MQVVVASVGKLTFGLVVHTIADIVETPMQLQGPSRTGVLGCVVVHDLVTEVVDLAHAASMLGRIMLEEVA